MKGKIARARLWTEGGRVRYVVYDRLNRPVYENSGRKSIWTDLISDAHDAVKIVRLAEERGLVLDEWDWLPAIGTHQHLL